MAEKSATVTAVQPALRAPSSAASIEGYDPRAAWAITIWLTVLAAINFLDKVVLGMVAVPLMRELHLTPVQFGVVAGSFYWLFSLSAAVVGFIGNRVPARHLLFGMAMLWALVQIPISIASSMTSLVLLRALLGAGEAPGFPVSVHALYKWFPNEKRNLPVAIINQGAIIGLFLAGVAIPLITRDWGWRANFVALAVASTVWGLGWLYFGREGTLQTQAPDRASAFVRLPYRRILTDPTVLSGFFASFAAYWGLALALTWLPAYLQEGLGYDAAVSGRLFAGIMALNLPVGLGLSWLSQRMLSRGGSSRGARAVFGSACVAIGGVLFVALLVLPLARGEKVALIALASALPTVIFVLGSAILGEIVPDAQRSALIAISTAVATSAGMIAPVVMGRLLQAQVHVHAQSFERGFAIGGVVMLIGATISFLGQHPARSLRRLYDPARSI